MLTHLIPIASCAVVVAVLGGCTTVVPATTTPAVVTPAPVVAPAVVTPAPAAVIVR